MKRWFYGRTQNIVDEKGNEVLMWAIYEGDEKVYQNKKPIAYFKEHDESVKFICDNGDWIENKPEEQNAALSAKGEG